MGNYSPLKEASLQISNMVNKLDFDPVKFCQLYRGEHRTLQQSFTRLCVEWLRTCGSDDYTYDLRNEASHTIGKAVSEVLENHSVPFI